MQALLDGFSLVVEMLPMYQTIAQDRQENLPSPLIHVACLLLLMWILLLAEISFAVPESA